MIKMLFKGKYLQAMILFCVLLHYARNVLSQKVYPWTYIQKEKRTICSTEECKKIGKMYRSHLNPKKNPCVDFYEYACGNWETKNPIPPDTDEWTARTVLQNKIAEDLKVILEGEVKDSDIGQAYAACAKRPALGQGKIDKILKYVERIDTWPRSKRQRQLTLRVWWEIDNYYISLTGESAFFDSRVVVGKAGRGLPLFQLKPLLSPYGSFIRLRDWTSSDTKVYSEFVADLINTCLHMKWEDVKISMDTVINVLNFREKLKAIADKAIQNNVGPTLLTVKDLQNMFQKEHHISKIPPMQWLKTMRALYENNSPWLINKDSEVVVRPIEYFASLANLLDVTPKDVIVNHIHLYFLERHLHLDDKWRNKLIKVIYTDKSCVTHNGRIRRPQERWRTCVDNLHSTHELNKLFVQNFFSPTMEKTTESIFSELKSVLAFEISTSDWQNDQTKAKSTAKAQTMEAWIGYPIWYDVPCLKKKHHMVHMTPIDANACLIPDRNIIFLTTGLLRPPMGCISDSLPITYATVGFSLAYESYQGFDTNGITYDAKGKVDSSWWSKVMQQKYKRQMKCFVNQYEDFLTKELKLENRKKCITTETFDKTMPDIMGVKLAYQLYRKKLFEHRGACSVPSQLKDFTCDQLFFLAYANTHCSTVSPNTEEYRATLDHSSTHYRVNGPLMNMNEFAKAFQCKPKDNMNLPAASRCDLWEIT